MGKYITAVDFGTDKTLMAVGEKSASGVRIVAFAEEKSKGISRGEVLNIKSVKSTLSNLVNEVEEQMMDIEDGFKVSTLYAGISGTNIRCEKTSVTRIRQDERRTIEQHEIDGMLAEAYKSFRSDTETVLHVFPQCYNIDDLRGLPDIEGHQGKEIMGFYIVLIGKAGTSDHTKSVINKAGYQIGKLVLGPVASACSVLTDEEMELGTAMVDIGAGTTDLLIVKDNKIRYSAVIPFGGDSITQDIRQMCNVTEKHAEAMKCKHGSCLSSLGADNKFIGITDEKGNIGKRIPFRQLFETIEARTEEIIVAVKNEIAICGMSNKINKIVLTGGGSNMNHISILFRQLTGYSVRQAIPYENKILANSCPRIFDFASSTVAGLIIKGFEYEEPDEEVQQVQQPTETEQQVLQVDEISTEKQAGRQKKGGIFHIFGHTQPGKGKNTKEEMASSAAETPVSADKKPDYTAEHSLFDSFFNDGNDDEA